MPAPFVDVILVDSDWDKFIVRVPRKAPNADDQKEVETCIGWAEEIAENITKEGGFTPNGKLRFSEIVYPGQNPA